MDTTLHASQPCLNSGAAFVLAPSLGFDRQRLQKLIDLLDRYDLTDNCSTDNSDLCAKLRAFCPF